LTTSRTPPKPALFRDRSEPGVAVLLYHRLVEDRDYPLIPPPESIFSMPVSRFEAQLDYLRRTGFEALTLPRFERIILGQEKAPARSVLITFDDGSESVHRLAAPRLAARGMPGVVFVTVDERARIFVQPHSQRRMTPDEMRAVEKQGVSCESHGMTHAGLGDLDDAALRMELLESRQRVGALVGREVMSLALPLNSYDRRVFPAARAAGYRLVFTSNPGVSRSGDPPLALRRILVEGGGSLEDFIRSLSPAGLIFRRILAWLKRVPPRLLGYRRWMPMRRALFGSPVGRLLTPAAMRRLLLLLAALAALAVAGALAVSLLRGTGHN